MEQSLVIESSNNWNVLIVIVWLGLLLVSLLVVEHFERWWRKRNRPRPYDWSKDGGLKIGDPSLPSNKKERPTK